LLVKRTVHLPAACLYFARLAYSKKFHKRRAVSNHAIVRMHVGCEQVVKPSNRIRLSDHSRDALGMPRAVVDWRVAPEERRTITVYAGYLREQLSRVFGPPIKWNMDAPCGQFSGFPQIRDTNHPMDGTIMGVDPKASVVDTDLRVHKIANLYIASCSTYPSGGSSNPTFTLLALTLRLADRVKQLASGVCGAST
jgi:choline dehydrogenase-like flavoprotein